MHHAPMTKGLQSSPISYPSKGRVRPTASWKLQMTRLDMTQPQVVHPCVQVSFGHNPVGAWDTAR